MPRAWEKKNTSPEAERTLASLKSRKMPRRLLPMVQRFLICVERV